MKTFCFCCTKSGNQNIIYSNQYSHFQLLRLDPNKKRKHCGMKSAWKSNKNQGKDQVDETLKFG